MRVYVLLALTALIVPAVVQAADDDSDPCKIALCLANPNGPTAVAECVPPIKHLMKRLAQGKSVPQCDMGGNGSAEQKGDLVIFKMDGQDTIYFNWKTGQSYTVPVRESATPVDRGGNDGNVRQQLK
jgi:hypothetical protein